MFDYTHLITEIFSNIMCICGIVIMMHLCVNMFYLGWEIMMVQLHSQPDIEIGFVIFIHPLNPSHYILVLLFDCLVLLLEINSIFFLKKGLAFHTTDYVLRVL